MKVRLVQIMKVRFGYFSKSRVSECRTKISIEFLHHINVIMMPTIKLLMN